MAGTYLVSDVHGHLADLRERLRDAGLLAGERWLGGDDGQATLWVLGDLVDRGPEGLGVVRLLRSLQQQAPDRVHVLLGNHEALMLGERLFPRTGFSELWLRNGGRVEDQDGLTDDDVAWLQGLPAMGRTGEDLLVHSDTVAYLQWGDSVEQVNSHVAAVLAGNDPQRHYEVFAALTERYDFLGADGPEQARRMLDAFGGSRVVHGHSIIATLVNRPSAEVTEPYAYADGLVLGIDGGRYDGGPLLLVRS
ncbi:MAG: metallophosphoesterase family protein [Nocardioidaceae bacterium]